MHRIAAIALRAGRRQRPQSFSTKPSSLSRSESQLRALEALQGEEGLGAVDEAEQALKRLAES